MHEKLIHELEEERHLRLQSEKRLREVTLESERNRVQMRGLQRQFSRMEETVRNLLQSQGPTEQKREESVNIMTYQEKPSEEERKHKEALDDLHMVVDGDSRSENSSTDEGREKTKLLLERLKALEAENSALALENENQRQQYERCLDEVANQVVQALLTQKDLREECVKLKTRVFDLEQQNRTLSILFQQRVRPTSDLLLQQSTQNWDKRLSIDSSLPSGFASSADELPPTRIKESHILEGLRKLQKRKVLLEPPSVITKWGYKDCMNSNEGIYSPGIKSGSLKEYPSSKLPGVGSPGRELHKTFVYDTDPQEDADEDSSSLALLQTVPNEGCRLHSSKLTHSVSDSLFGWEPDGKHFSEDMSSVYPREKPEKLSHCASNYPLDRKLCPSVQVPQVQRERDPHNQGHSHMALSLQLSDTDDNETLDELRIESSDDKSPSDLSLTADTDKSTENLDILIGFRKSELESPKEEKTVPTYLETRPKTFGFIKQQRVVKRTSSEECVTVIFDAEDGEPVEFSSHQTGVVTVTRNEISINTASAGPKAEHTELSPQGIAHLQLGAAATRDSAFLKRSEEGSEKSIPKDDMDNVPLVTIDSSSPQSVTQNAARQKLTKPTHNMSCQNNSRSGASVGIYQKQSLTKIPARGKSSPQKSKIIEPEASTLGSPSGLVTLEKSSALLPGKLSRFMKTESPGPFCSNAQTESHIPKHPLQTPHVPKMSSRKDSVQCSKSQTPGLRSRPLAEPHENGDPPTRDQHCDSEPDMGMKSPSPPPPPGRSVSLLVRSSYDYLPPPSSAKSETRVPNDTARTVFKTPLLKGTFAPVISSNHATTEVQRKKPSVAFKKPVFTHAPPSTETTIPTRCPAHIPTSSFAMMSPGPPKFSPKRGVPKTSPHQTLGTIHTDTGIRTPKNCPSIHEPVEIASKSVSPGRKGQVNDSVLASPKPSFLGANESPSSQVNSSSSSFKSHSAPYGCHNAHEKGLKTRLPVGLKVLMKSPQLLRKSSTVPGKHEKDSLNEASRSSVAVGESKPEDSGHPARLETAGNRGTTSTLGSQGPDSLAEGLPLETALPESLENSIPGTDGKDGVENRSVKRSLSSSKPHLKPALGMNGAKARSQSFSAHSGDKPSTPPMEGSGKIRTQIITNTAERGNSLTRQNASAESSPPKTSSAPTSESPPSAGKPLGHSFSRQCSQGSTGSSSSQHGSPSKLPLRIPPKPEGIPTPPGMEHQQAFAQVECAGLTVPGESGSDHCRCLPTPAYCPQALMAPGRTQPPNNLETSRASKLETSGRHPDASKTETGAVSPEAPLSPTIEEKVMLCIQENVEKGQVQTKSTSVEAKPKPGPSFASWFGFRKSRLPALSSRKMDVSKTKVEKKDAKLKSERKKEKKKSELQYEIENELNRGNTSEDSPEVGLQSKNNLKTSPDIYNRMKLEPRNRPIPVMSSAKDNFMTELLNRVDKKGAQQTESGSKNVSCRNMLKGSSQGSCLIGSSISTQGSHKKNVKTKADVVTPRDSLIKEANENLQEDEEDTIADSAFQSHNLESNCQMRTLDSGIGTFPLPESGNRSMGRYICPPDSPEETDPLLSLQPAPSTVSSIRAQTLEREVPSSADSQCSTKTAIVHSISDPIMTARGMRPQSRLPKPASSGRSSLQKQKEAGPTPRTCSSFKYAEDTMAGQPLPGWGGEDAAAETQKLKQVEETKEDSENRLSKISLESFNKFNSNTVILLEKENSLNKVEGQKEEKEKNEEASLSSSDRPGVDNLESLSDSLYDSFSSCASQGSNDV
uniref:NCK associated protein 5 n=1 Tax=Marmota marmota marmota TaxID=9994 RepID=A0A8C6EYQ8_MARMA